MGSLLPSTSGSKGANWTKQLYFKPEANKAKVDAYSLSDKESYLQFLELIDQNDIIEKLWLYSEKLFNWQLYQGIWMWHAFIVFKSTDWYWSIEKNKTGITIQKSKLLSDVRDQCCEMKRNTPLKERKEIEIEIKDVIDWLYYGNELNKEYRVSDCNCKDFAEGLESFVTNAYRNITGIVSGVCFKNGNNVN